ncbi:hypothetical protein TcCL_ESM00988 [Trypanosoma cruzi]|nr:hypothetical protein TcCL_ESM00988 [Trypanosoma cruzi]
MENTRRKEPPLWLNPAVHVWITKNDIPVVNLRDISEKLRLPRSAFRADEAPQTPDEESCPAESASSNGEKTPEPTKTESLNALLGIAQRRSEKQATPPTQLLAVPSNPPASGGSGASKEPETKAPSFPKTQPAAAMDVEFVQGVNLPGEKNTVTPVQPQPDGVQSVALFHDPVWGEVGSSYDIDCLAPREEEKIDVLSSLKFGILSENVNKNELSTTGTATTTTATPPAFTASNQMSEMMYQPPPHPPAMTSSPQQIAYPQGISLGASGWTTAPPPGHGVAVHPLQFVGLPFPFMSQAAVMAVPQPYRVPYQFYQMHPQAPPLAPVPPQAGAYQTSPNPDLYQIAAQKLANQQSSSPRPGTNVGAAPFIPGGKSV